MSKHKWQNSIIEKNTLSEKLIIFLNVLSDGGAGRLIQGKNTGEQDERYHNRGSQYRFEKRSDTRENSRDLQGWNQLAI